MRTTGPGAHLWLPLHAMKPTNDPPFAEVKGQESVKRAIEIFANLCKWCITSNLRSRLYPTDLPKVRDVHGVDEAKPFLDAALADEALDSLGDVDEAAAVGDFEPEVFGQAFHTC